ncbi:MAG: four helix bundle protein [Anaerolineae bacterium CG_4_9_14_3_um_filter_57_17]|nr:diversity-generating retroelement protein Avd [bacterium]NCT21694.1 diversity-generating retroelement protein Avd [bacterium]PJB65123.1 MAG: four helix bundle protein [Anaerolineae bacterium CG_4_9_14_3_um_filter_57_17]
MKESPIFTRSYELLQWLIPATVKFPRQQRFVLAAAIQKTALELHEKLIEAAKSDAPLPLLRQADVLLTKLRFYLRLCRDLELLKLGQYEHASRIVSEIGRLLGGWIKKLVAPGEPEAPTESMQIASR